MAEACCSLAKCGYELRWLSLCTGGLLVGRALVDGGAFEEAVMFKILIQIRLVYLAAIFFALNFGVFGQNLCAAPRTIRAIGDIQGDIQALNEILLASGSTDSAGKIQANLTLIFIGDLVGTGPNSPAVIERVMNLFEQASERQSEVIFIAGNHEINLLTNRYQAISKEDQRHWKQWLDPESESDWRESLYHALHSPREDRSNGKILRHYFQLLRPWYQVDSRFFVHAGVSDKMLEGIGSRWVVDFQNKVAAVLNGEGSITPFDWLFSIEGPALTARTADPEHAEFLLEEPVGLPKLERFMGQHQVHQIIVGHWSTRSGELSNHSLFGDRILHIDTGINLPKGKLSYVDFRADGSVLRQTWARGELALGESGMHGLFRALGSSGQTRSCLITLEGQP